MASTEPATQLREGLPPVKVRYVPLPSPLPAKVQEPIRRVATSDMRPPCRRCLQDASPGEEVDLIAYDPFPANAVTPYRGLGPIFVHVDDCAMFDGGSVPARQLQRSLAVRAYDENHMMMAAEVIDGNRLEEVCGGMLADEKARYVMAYNAKPGCFAFKVERA